MSKRFSLNKRQVLKGLLLTMIGALLPLLTGIINSPEFDIRTICSWELLNNIIKTSASAGFGYILITFFENKSQPEANDTTI
jgi:hypothetical protein